MSPRMILLFFVTYTNILRHLHQLNVSPHDFIILRHLHQLMSPRMILLFFVTYTN